MDNIVIVGSGQGGLQMAASLRQEGYAGAITLIGDEPGLPYQRPPLSKAYMADGNGAALLLKPRNFFEKAQVSLIEGCRAVAIDRPARAVALADGRRISYDHLVLATGSRNLVPPLPGVDAPGVMGLRTLEDAERLRRALSDTRHAVVVGGGFIGLEFAAMARKTGLAVTVVEAAPRLMARAVSPAMSDAFLAKHRALGTDIRLSSPAAGIVRTGAAGRAAGVLLKDGTAIDGDLVLLAVGVRPNSELAADAGLAVDNGVVVDGTLRTSDPAISALGDVCSFPFAGRRVRLESVQAAVDHARHIARVLLKGETASYRALPWFWSDQADWKLQIAGVALDTDEDIAPAGDTATPLVLRFREDTLVSVETVNDAGSHMAARNLIGCRKSLLAEHGFDLRAALLTARQAQRQTVSA